MGFYCSYGAQSRTIQGIKHTFLPRQTSISYRFLHILSCPFLKPSSPAVPYGAEFAGRHNIRLLDTPLLPWSTGPIRHPVPRPTAYDQSPLAGVALSWNPTTLPALSLSAGYLHEQGKLLGSQGSGAFGELSGHTLFLRTGLATTTEQRWELSAQGEVGMVTPAVAQSQFIKDISTLTSSAFRLQAHKRLAKGASFRLALSQPLRVESGAASLSLPTGRTKDGLVVGTALSAPLTPSGRQLDARPRWTFPCWVVKLPWPLPAAPASASAGRQGPMDLLQRLPLLLVMAHTVKPAGQG